MTVYTGHSGDRAHATLLGQVQVGTALGVAVPLGQHAAFGLLAEHRHRDGGASDMGGGATQAAFQDPFRHLFFTFFNTFANVLTPPSVHQLVHVCYLFTNIS